MTFFPLHFMQACGLKELHQLLIKVSINNFFTNVMYSAVMLI